MNTRLLIKILKDSDIVATVNKQGQIEVLLNEAEFTIDNCKSIDSFLVRFDYVPLGPIAYGHDVVITYQLS